LRIALKESRGRWKPAVQLGEGRFGAGDEKEGLMVSLSGQKGWNRGSKPFVPCL